MGQTTLPLRSRVTCPHCWKQFAPKDALYISQHPDLLNDPRLGADHQQRFLPTRFTVDGAALDARGYACHALACPGCHLEVPRIMFEMHAEFFSILGAPSCGKTYFLASMTWQLRRTMPQFFRLAQMLLNRHPEAYDAVVLTGSALRTPTDLNPRPLNARWRGPHAHGLEWLSRDEAIWAAFRDDPLTTEVPLLTLFGPIEAARLYGLPKKDLGRRMPVLLMVGGDDPVGGPRSVHKLADAYRTRSGLTDVTTLVYPDACHELFNELQQDDVRADLVAWLDARLPAQA